MKIVVINHTREDIVVHRAGCADVARTLAKRFTVNSHWKMDIGDEDPAVAVSRDLNESFGWTPESGESEPWPASYINVKPCARPAAR